MISVIIVAQGQLVRPHPTRQTLSPEHFQNSARALHEYAAPPCRVALGKAPSAAVPPKKPLTHLPDRYRGVEQDNADALPTGKTPNGPSSQYGTTHVYGDPRFTQGIA